MKTLGRKAAGGSEKGVEILVGQKRLGGDLRRRIIFRRNSLPFHCLAARKVLTQSRTIHKNGHGSLLEREEIILFMRCISRSIFTCACWPFNPAVFAIGIR